MPYILPERRKTFDPVLDCILPAPENVGDLNYVVTKAVHSFVIQAMHRNGGKLSYEMLSAAAAVLQDAHDEFKRTILDPYENLKRAQNGPISQLDAGFSDKPKVTAYDILKALAGVAREAQPTPVKTEADVYERAAAEIKDFKSDPVIHAQALRAEDNPSISAPPAVHPAPDKSASHSNVRRRPQVSGGAIQGDVLGGREVTSAEIAAPTEERNDGSVRKRTAPKGHEPADVSERAQRVWDAAGEGSDEEYGI